MQKSLTSGNSHPREVNNEQSKGDIFEGSASRIYWQSVCGQQDSKVKRKEVAESGRASTKTKDVETVPVSTLKLLFWAAKTLAMCVRVVGAVYTWKLG